MKLIYIVVCTFKKNPTHCASLGNESSSRWSFFRIPVIISHKPSITHSIKSWKTCRRGFPGNFASRYGFIMISMSAAARGSKVCLDRQVYVCTRYLLEKQIKWRSGWMIIVIQQSTHILVHCELSLLKRVSETKLDLEQI